MYKKTTLSVLYIFSALISSATISISFNGGTLYGDDVASPMADSSLVIAVTTANPSFGGPVAGSFVSGGDTILGSWAVDSVGTGSAGAFDVTLSNIAYGGGVIFNQKISLYWFNGISSLSNLPTVGTKYGSYSDLSWVVPADGSLLVTYSLATVSLGGSVPNSATVANLTVSAVPEPATYAALVGVAALGFCAVRRRRRA